MLLLLAVASLAAAAYFAFDAVTMPAQQRRALVRRAATYGKFRPKDPVTEQAFSERTLTPIKETLAGWVLRLNPKASVEGVNQRLMAAGLGVRFSPTGFLAAKAGAALGGALLGFVLGSGSRALLFALLVGGLGYKAPDFLLSSRARKRKAQLRADIPDALDLLAVSVEAGLGFDAAILKLMEHMKGPLAEEFALTLGEMRMGESRSAALKHLAERTDLQETATFTRAIIQADQLGISLGRILRVQAADSRNRRQSEAEEKAAKAPIKMLFPTAGFIFPAIFIVALGPAFLKLGEIF